MASWYYVKNGERNGPVAREELDARIVEGAVEADTLVWSVGMSAWARAASLPEFGFPPPVPPPPLPPPIEPAGFAPVFDPAPDAEAARRRALELVEKELAEARAASAPEFAGFWERFAAKMLDGVLLYGMGLMVERAVVALYFDGLLPVVTTDWVNWLRLMAYTAPVNILIAVLYSVYFIAKHEATPGKRLLGLRVVRADGGKVGSARVVGRYFAEQLSAILFMVGYVMAAFDEEKRTLHDYLCDTRVVKGAREEQPQPRASGLPTEQ